MRVGQQLVGGPPGVFAVAIEKLPSQRGDLARLAVRVLGKLLIDPVHQLIHLVHVFFLRFPIVHGPAPPIELREALVGIEARRGPNVAILRDIGAKRLLMGLHVDAQAMLDLLPRFDVLARRQRLLLGHGQADLGGQVRHRAGDVGAQLLHQLACVRLLHELLQEL